MPKAVEFGELPKTSTGKVQKFVLTTLAIEQTGEPTVRRVNVV